MWCTVATTCYPREERMRLCYDCWLGELREHGYKTIAELDEAQELGVCNEAK
ncbi:MAG: hypothetical protein MJZ99_07025 [Bacteroidales bacterium]|nr:hypothetical protein [Bacteroidales bacterium]